MNLFDTSKLILVVVATDSLGLLSGSFGNYVPFKEVKQSAGGAVGNEIEKLHYIWYLCALNALLGVVGKEMFSTMDKRKKRAFVKCLKNIREDLDIPSGARCIVAALDNDFKGLLRKNNETHKHHHFEKKPPAFLLMHPEKRFRKLGFQTSITEWINSSVRKVSTYLAELWERKFSGTKNVKKRSTSEASKFNIKVMDKAPNLNYPEDDYASLSKSPLLVAAKVATSLYKGARGKSDDKRTWKQVYNDLIQIKKFLDGYKDATKRHYRLIDAIIDMPSKRQETGNDLQQFVGKDTPPLLKDLISLLNKFGKYNGGNPDVQLFSPRIAPIIPDPDNSRKFGSPNILPLYEEDPKINNLTVPGLLRIAGVPEKERSAIMELIMQITGAQDMISNTLNRISNYSKTSEAEGYEMTKRFKQLNDHLNKTFSRKQRSDMKLKNYTFLRKDQMLKIFGSRGANDTSHFAFDLDEYDKWTPAQKKKALFNTIRSMANWGTPQANSTRRKRAAVTLAPFMFAPPVFQLVILSPITLSPNIFSPNVFAPSALSPIILSPQVGDPGIFSPYVLSPLVLSPQLMSPNIFTPYVLSPNILSPFALSPIVFSPPVLSPNILNPTLLCGPIFSPLVLSPSIKSKAFWGISLFSPSALS